MKKICNSFSIFTLLAVLTLVTFSCKDNKPDPVPEDTSKITNLVLQLDTNQKGHNDATATVQNADGIDGKETNAITLDANGTYIGSIVLEDETKTPKATVTNEYTIAYQFTGTDAIISASGTTPTFTTKAAGSGTLRITLTKASKSTVVTVPVTIR